MSVPLRITLLGTGTSQGIPVIGCTCMVCRSADPRDRRTRTAAYIRAGDTGLSLDIGPDFRGQMLANGLHDVHAILLTHEHNDHISGLDDIRPVNFLYDRDIPLYGSQQAIGEVTRRFYYAFDPGYYYPGKPRVRSVVIDARPFTFRNIEIVPIPVDHGDMPVLGYRIGSLAYVTDAKIIPETSKALLRDLDVLILNALRVQPHPTHLNIEEAVTLCNELKPNVCYLTHIGHTMGLHAEAEAMLPAGIHLGYDGLVVDV